MNNSSVWNSCDFPIRKRQEKWWTCNFVSSIIFFLLLLQCKEKMRPVKKALKMLESPEGTMTEKDQVSQTRQVDFYFSFLVPLTQLCLTRSNWRHRRFSYFRFEFFARVQAVEVEMNSSPGCSEHYWSILTHFYQSTCLSIFEKNCAVILSQKTKFFLSKLRYILICSCH